MKRRGFFKTLAVTVALHVAVKLDVPERAPCAQPDHLFLVVNGALKRWDGHAWRTVAEFDESETRQVFDIVEGIKGAFNDADFLESVDARA